MTEINVEQIVSDLAANLGVGEDRLRTKMSEVLAENGPAWASAGKDDVTCQILSARVAGRQLKMIGERLGHFLAKSFVFLGQQLGVVFNRPTLDILYYGNVKLLVRFR